MSRCALAAGTVAILAPVACASGGQPPLDAGVVADRDGGADTRGPGTNGSDEAGGEAANGGDATGAPSDSDAQGSDAQGGGGGAIPCAPNQVLACACPGGQTGARRCVPDGTAWTACDCATYGAEFAVSLTGSDSAPGTLAQPFETLERAQTAVRAAFRAGTPAGGVVVWLRGGIYERSATLTLGAADSGRPGAPVTWRSYPGEIVRLVGGHRLDPSWFAPVTATSPVWSRLDPSAQGNVMSINLAPHGVTNFGQLAPRGFGVEHDAALELFVDGAPMTLARWPDVNAADPKSGFAATAAPVTATSFAYTGTRPARWTGARDVWLHGFWGNTWADMHVPVANIDPTSSVVTVTSNTGYPLKAGQPYLAYNLLEELTSPGEWYLDRATGLLYLWPPSTPLSSDIIVSVLDAPLVQMTNAAYITLRDLTLEATHARLAEIQSGDHDALEGLTLRNAGTDGAFVQGTNLSVHHCLVTGTGGRGVSVSGGDRPTLTPANNVVDGCAIHDFARWTWTYHPGVDVAGVANIVRNNRIYDAPHAAILFRGNEHLIELNEIYRVCNASSDAGAIYSGRNWGFRGVSVKNNFIHDLQTWQTGLGVHGIYLDDTLAGIDVEGNVFYAVSGAALKHGGGRDDVLTNNVVARCGTALASDTRGASGMYDLLPDLESVHYQQDPWKSRYAACAAIPDSWTALTAAGALWLYPQGTIFSRNVGFMNGQFMSTSTAAVAAKYFAETKDNVSNQDPLFVDEKNLDLTLSPNSPALQIPGFQPIPFHNIGIRP
jgi:hypothetical protein